MYYVAITVPYNIIFFITILIGFSDNTNIGSNKVDNMGVKNIYTICKTAHNHAL